MVIVFNVHFVVLFQQYSFKTVNGSINVIVPYADVIPAVDRPSTLVVKVSPIARLPSGKHTKNYGKSPLLIGKSSINGPFSIAM